VEDIPNLFKANSDVIVQVTKAPIGTKGARVTTNISLAGRYLVLLPHSPHVGISKRIADREERNRLRQVLRKLKLPKGMGLICRTVGEGVSEKEFQDDLSELLERWRSAEATAEKERAPACLYREPDLVERTLRDWMTEDVDEIVADSREIHKTAQDLVRRYSQKRIRVRLHNSPTPLFQKCNVSQQVENVFSRQVPLPSGGYLTVDETEALVAIDVNSGKNRGGKNHPETILSTNLEACEEIARQLRLRNVGGLVVLDLIDMRSRKDQQAVYRAFRTHMKRDRARNRILPISPLGLIEMTRQREHESVRDTVYGPCPYCHGRGLVKSSASMSVEIQRRLAELLRRRGQRQIRVMVHPQVLARLKNEDADLLAEMEEEFGGELSFRAEEGLHVEEFRVVDQRSGKEL
jgi:ribonuclease G